MTTPANLRPDAFAGAAVAYARYRPPYPPQLLRALLDQAGVAPGGALLDLACGPGRVALDLAGAFETVWAIDLEPEMIEVGRLAAVERNVENVQWSTGRAEDLAAPPGAFDLITIGEAFHRLDQRLIAQKALGWLRPGGCLATLGGDGVLAGQEPWQLTVAEVAHRWMARAFPEGWADAGPGAEVGPEAQERVLREAGFADVARRTFREPHGWTFAEVVGYLRSTSVCSNKALGDDFAAFEAELKSALLALAPSLTFAETMTWGFTLARKGGRSPR